MIILIYQDAHSIYKAFHHNLMEILLLCLFTLSQRLYDILNLVILHRMELLIKFALMVLYHYLLQL